MNQATKEFRKNIADTFIKALSEKQLDWKKNWSGGAMERPVNAITGKGYKGLNWISLMLNNMHAVDKGMVSDNRWATFKQIQDKGWKVRKGARGCKVEYWQPYDFKQKKPISWEEFVKATKDPDRREEVGAIAKYYVVFNGRDIEGIPELEAAKERTVVSDDIIQKISVGMQVEIKNDGGSRAFYRPSEDCIHVPTAEAFYSTYDYNTTVLHELSHATGAEHRLNRNIKNAFGSLEYAYEELVAEISACFMGEHLQIEQTKEHLENHKAYVQSWIEEITEKPEVLVRAIRDAGNAANLLEYHAGILTQEEYQKSLQESQEVSADKVYQKEEVNASKEGIKELLEKNDVEELKKIVLQAEFKPEEPHFDSNYNVILFQKATANIEGYNVILSFHNAYNPRMIGSLNEAVKQKVRVTIFDGEQVQKMITIQELSTKSIKTAEKNYRSILESWKGYTGQKEIKIPISIEADIKANGFKPTKQLVGKIRELNRLTGKEHSLKDIKSSFQEKRLQGHPEARKVENSIVKMLQKQEMAKMPVPIK